MSPGRQRWVAWTAGFLLAYGVVSMAAPRSYALTALGDLLALALLLVGVALMAQLAISTQGQSRAFWSLMTASLLMWSMNQVGWTWVEVIARKPLPDPFFGDTVLFLHVVPMIAALTIRPHRLQAERKLYFTTLNFLMLLLWWVFLYMFAIFPDEYVAFNVQVYSRTYDMLYIVENLLLIIGFGLAYLNSRGAWRRIYANFAIASGLYLLSSSLMNVAIARGVYYTGSFYDVPFFASLCWFVGTAMLAKETRPEAEVISDAHNVWSGMAPRAAMVAILSLPILAFWALYLDSAPIQLKEFRVLVALVAMLAMGLFLFLKQYRLDRDLIGLLQESHQSYENLQRLQSQLVQKEKLASLGQLVAGAAHEINNPLTAILGYSELLATNAGLSTEQASMAQKIGQQARRTRDLVSDLLSFARQSSAEKSSVDLAALLTRALKMHSGPAERKKIILERQNTFYVPPVWGNSNQLLQAMLQILENAIDAVEEAGGGKVTITLEPDGNDVLLQFSDTGVGIRDPQRVFDPFYTTKPIGKGTGLGLSVTYGVIRDHQGQITCHNKPDRGAVFVVRLPAAPAVSTAASGQA
jgi:signal transduction histidine kinase